MRHYRYSGIKEKNSVSTTGLNKKKTQRQQSNKAAETKEKNEQKDEAFKRFQQEREEHPQFGGLGAGLASSFTQFGNERRSMDLNNKYAERMAFAEINSGGTVRWAPDPRNPHSLLEGDTCFVNNTRVPPHLEHWILDPFGDKRPRDRKMAKREKALTRQTLKHLSRQRRRLGDMTTENIEEFDSDSKPLSEVATEPSEERAGATNLSSSIFSPDTDTTAIIHDPVTSTLMPPSASAFKHTTIRQRRVAHLIEETMQSILTHHTFLTGPPSLALAQSSSKSRRKQVPSPPDLLQGPKIKPPRKPSLLETLGPSQHLTGSSFQRAQVQITHVEVSRNLLHAKIWWRCLPGHEEAVKRDFELLSVQLRTLLTVRIQLKYSPQLIFIRDAPKQIHAELNARLDQIEKELKQYSSSDDNLISSSLFENIKFKKNK
jgi:ribosome-binding factor A